MIELCVPMEDVRGRSRLRSASTGCILLPRRGVQTSTGQRSFAYNGPAVWNSLPPALRENMSLATFETKQKTYLLRRSQRLSKTTRRCCGVLLISAPRYKWLYLLTYLLRSIFGQENLHKIFLFAYPAGTPDLAVWFPKFSAYFLVLRYRYDKMLMKILFYQFYRDVIQTVERCLYLKTLKNPSKNSWIGIQMRLTSNSPRRHAKYGVIASREVGVNGQWMNERTDGRTARKHDALSTVTISGRLCRSNLIF